MPYRSGFEFRYGGLGPYLGAIPFAAIGAAFTGVTVLVFWLLATEIPWVAPSSVGAIVWTIIGSVTGVFFAVTAATFVIGFYLAVFGLPVALVMGRYLHSRWALAIALLDAGASALFVITGDRIGAIGSDGPSLLYFLLVLSFALPAGVLYRRGVIEMREQAAFFYDS